MATRYQRLHFFFFCAAPSFSVVILLVPPSHDFGELMRINWLTRVCKCSCMLPVCDWTLTNFTVQTKFMNLFNVMATIFFCLCSFYTQFYHHENRAAVDQTDDDDLTLWPKRKTKKARNLFINELSERFAVIVLWH